MRLDVPTQIKTGSWSFRYFCPKALSIKTAQAKTKNAAKVKWNAVKILQGQTPESPTASLTPLGVIIEKYLEDRLRDVKSKKIQRKYLETLTQHLARLNPHRLDNIKCDNSKRYRFIYHCVQIGRTKTFKTADLKDAEIMHKKIETLHRQNDVLRDEKIAALNQPIKDLRWEFIENVLNNINRSRSTRAHYHNSITAVIHWAVDKGYLSNQQLNIIAKAKPKRGPIKEQVIPSEESVKRLIDNSEDFWKPFWMIKATVGPRVSELTALAWKNVHLNEGHIYIGQKTDDEGNITDDLKTDNAYRSLPINGLIIRLLSRLPRDGKLVFPCPEFTQEQFIVDKLGRSQKLPSRRLRKADEERPMTHIEVRRYGLMPIITKHKIEWNGKLHILRHFAASRMIDKNWNVKRIQKRLGHANAKTTLDIYGHLMDRQSFPEEAEELSHGLF